MGSRLLVSALEADPWKKDEGVGLDSEVQNREFSTDPWRAWEMRKSLGLYQAAANTPELYIPPG